MTDDEVRLAVRAIVPIPDALFTVDALEAASRRAREAPAELTDVDLRHLVIYTPKEIPALIRRHADALQRRADEAFAAAQQRTANALAAAHAQAPIDAKSLGNGSLLDPLLGLSFEELCAKFPNEPATVGLVGEVVAFAEAMNAKNVERNEKIAALEQRAEALVKQLADLRIEMDALITVRS